MFTTGIHNISIHIFQKNAIHIKTEQSVDKIDTISSQ